MATAHSPAGSAIASSRRHAASRGERSATSSRSSSRNSSSSMASCPLLGRPSGAAASSPVAMRASHQALARPAAAPRRRPCTPPDAPANATSPSSCAGSMVRPSIVSSPWTCASRRCSARAASCAPPRTVTSSTTPSEPDSHGSMTSCITRASAVARPPGSMTDASSSAPAGSTGSEAHPSSGRRKPPSTRVSARYSGSV